MYFNPHPPCGGWPKSGQMFHWKVKFQSTPSVWRVTSDTSQCLLFLLTISIHTLRVEGDTLRQYSIRRTYRFQSTPSVWRVTSAYGVIISSRWDFNPHPPCGGWLFVYCPLEVLSNFNPHPPCGGWPPINLSVFYVLQNFNPHPPCGGWQDGATGGVQSELISIHTLRVEGDQYTLSASVHMDDFNPHPPCGGWQ